MDANRTKAAAKKLVDGEKVFALVGTSDPITSHVAYPYVRDNGVPIVGTEAVDLVAYDDIGMPNIFNFSSNAMTDGATSAKLAVETLGHKKLALLIVDLPVANAWVDTVKEWAKKLGGQVVREVRYPVAAVDFGPYILQLRGSSPDMVMHVGPIETSIRANQARQRTGWQVPWSETREGYRDLLPKYLGSFAEGIVGISANEYHDADTQPVREMRQGIKASYPDLDFSGWSVMGWMYGKVFVDMLSRDCSQLTRAGVMNRLNSLKNYETGFTPPVTIYPGHHDDQGCVKFVQVKDGKWAHMNNGQWVCVGPQKVDIRRYYPDYKG
jgi:branched-chain amino acid transport system substrate-binding protein